METKVEERLFDLYDGEISHEEYKKFVPILNDYLRDSQNFSEAELTQVYLVFCGVLNDYRTAVMGSDISFTFAQYLEATFPTKESFSDLVIQMSLETAKCDLDDDLDIIQEEQFEETNNKAKTFRKYPVRQMILD